MNLFKKKWEVVEDKSKVVANQFRTYSKAIALRDQLNWQSFEKNISDDWYYYIVRLIK